MAATLELLAPTGLTLTVELYPHGSDTIANTGGDSLTEATNRKGLYTATVAETLSGWHTAHAKLSGTVISAGDVNMVDGETCRVRDHDPAVDAQEIRDALKLAPSAGDAADGSIDALLSGLAASIAVVAAAVWSYASRTLTQAAAAVVAALAGSTITIHRGDTLTVSLTGLGDLIGRTKLWITGKQDRGHPDTAALFQIEESAGLLTINGATATTAANGSLTVTDEAAGDITIMLLGVETAKLAQLTAGVYDVQILTDAGPQTLTDSTLVVDLDVTRATS